MTTVGSAALPVYGWGSSWLQRRPTAPRSPDRVTTSATRRSSRFPSTPPVRSVSRAVAHRSSPSRPRARRDDPALRGRQVPDVGQQLARRHVREAPRVGTVVGGCQISFHGWKNVICSQQGVPTAARAPASGRTATARRRLPSPSRPSTGRTGYTNAKPGPNAALRRGLHRRIALSSTATRPGTRASARSVC